MKIQIRFLVGLRGTAFFRALLLSTKFQPAQQIKIMNTLIFHSVIYIFY